ncbi:MAG: hypothetical protein IK130_06625 [Oscillospiraceae bacterium]|nr:hypothetical protein [Oscillospiraceae bacterium]
MHNAEIYQKLLDAGITNVWLPDMEFLPPDQMEKRKALWKDDLLVDDLTIFAVDGYGSFYAWRPDDSVIFVDIGPADTHEAASCLPDAVFRQIIEFANGDYAELCTDAEKADMDPDDAEDYTSESEAIGLLKQYRAAFGAYFTQEQNDYLDTLIQNGFLPDCAAFIEEEEMMRIIRDRLHVDTQKSGNLAR